MLGSGLGSIINSTVIGIALDLVNSLVWFKVLPSGNWNGSGAADPATGVGGLSLWGPGIPIYPYAPFGNAGDKITANFGDSAFTGTAPSGFTAGFTAGATPALNEVATQVGVETWGNSNPSLNLTQIGIEVWGTPVGPGTEVTVTQIGAEVWAAVQAAPVGPPRRRPIVTIIQ